MMATQTLRPRAVCQSLLAALDASQGRSRSRKRDQTPDAIGLELRRTLLEQAVRDDPDPDSFEHWLLEHSETSPTPGATLAIARAVRDEWQLAHRLETFSHWLEEGAPSDDAPAPAPIRPEP